jgi:hypothetical protein
MDPLGPVLLFLVFGLLVAGVAYYQHQRRLERRRQLGALAFGHGLDFSIDDPFGTLGEPFALLQRGDGRGIENVLWGTWQGLELRAFDYWYYEESTDSDGNRTKTTYRYTCCLLEIEAAFPPLALTRENVFTRMADGLGFRDIELESPDFNKRFQVKAKDRRFAFSFVDARMMKWLLALAGKEEFEVAGGWLLVFHRGRRKPVGFAPLIETALAFRTQVPRAALSMYGRDEGAAGERP